MGFSPVSAPNNGLSKAASYLVATDRVGGRQPEDAADSQAEAKPISGKKCQHFSEEFSQTPATCNTGVSIRQEGLESGGLDTLEISLYGFWTPSIWEDLKAKLDRAKAHAEGGVDEAAYIRSDENDVLTVAAVGVRKGVFCRWTLNWEGCRIAIVANPAPSDHRLSVHVTIGSVRLMDVGHVRAWESVLAVLKSLGYEHCREVVGRADLCVDLADASMTTIELAINERRLICKARKSKRYENSDKLETYTRGAGALLVRIYDKAVECRNDPVKQAMLIERRWGKLCHEAVRVEFQIRGKSLKRFFNVRSVADLFKHLGSISLWCDTEWFRIVNEFDRKNRNHARAEVSEFWQQVQQKFHQWTGQAVPVNRPPRRTVPEFKQLKQQAVGCITSLAAHIDDGRDFMTHVSAMAEEVRHDVEKIIAAKRAKLASAARVLSPLDEVPF